MQRTLNNTIPPSQRSQPQQGAQPSPAYTMAYRIRNEQGRERAGEYLCAMEPFLAPGEREHIAAMLDIPLVSCARTVQQPQYAPQQREAQAPPMQSTQSMPNMSSINQLMQLLGGMGKGSSQPASGGMNPIMLAQLLGNMMGRR